MEELLQYVWKHRLLPLHPLRTTGGETVEIVDPGLHNHDAGPDFFNAKVRVGQTLWVGNVEVHLRSSDWYRHRHNEDVAYNNVVLHVVEKADQEVMTQDGRQLTQLEMKVPEELVKDYQYLLTIDRYPRCHRIIPSLQAFTVHSWMDTLLQERLRQRTIRIEKYREQTGGDWEKTLFIALSRSFGFGTNSDAFEAWARLIPLEKIGKHRDDLFQIEAIFLGQAGLLAPNGHPEQEADEYRQRLEREFCYQQRLFQLPPPLPLHQWKYLRLRPQNFPHIRLSQLAWVYSQSGLNLSRVQDAMLGDQPLKTLTELLKAQTSDYWKRHIMFGKPTKTEKPLTLSIASRRLLIINAVVPVLWTHATARGNASECEQLEEMLRQMPAEDNNILRLWQECGLDVSSAADSQSLIHLKKEYCDKRRCLQCSFGYEYLRRTNCADDLLREQEE